MGAEIQWGDTIKVIGKPDWLGHDIPMRWSVVMKDGSCFKFVNTNSDRCANWKGEGFGVAIRLPADHEHYGYMAGVDRTDIRTVEPALVERMVALVRRAATGALVEEQARDILKALEPVDEDLAEARNIACENSRWDRGNCFWEEVQQGKSDHIPMVQAALAAIKRGRELERERGEAGR